MITLDDYKKLLVEYYVFDVDNTAFKQIERTALLSVNYTDAYLNQIVENTNEFVEKLFEERREKKDYWQYHLGTDARSTIFLGLTGLDNNSDVIYYDGQNKAISSLILKKVFGKDFTIIVKEESHKDCYMIMDGFPTNMDELQGELVGRARSPKTDF